MLIKEVKKMKVLDRWLYWVQERENVRLARLKQWKRGDKQKPPWTDDEILQSYRFCNVRRMDDKVSQWLLTNWYEPNKDHPNMLLAVALARFVNKPESLMMITSIVFNDDGWQADAIVDSLRKYRDKGNTVFNGAYMVRGNDGMDKIDCVVNYYVEPLKKVNDTYPKHSMENAWLTILPSFGMGSFMVGQIVADLRWAVTGEWLDKYEWAPMGPGSKRGMNRIMEVSTNATMSQEAFLSELTKLIQIGKHGLPKSLTERLEAQDWQNTLCEFDKYERCLHGEGKPKQKYPGS